MPIGTTPNPIPQLGECYIDGQRHRIELTHFLPEFAGRGRWYEMRLLNEQGQCVSAHSIPAWATLGGPKHFFTSGQHYSVHFPRKHSCTCS